MAETVSPTRMNMLQRKSQIGLAEQGVDLLKNKRDALMKEFFDLVKPYVRQRVALIAELQAARGLISMSEAESGTERVRAAALAASRECSLDVKVQNIWGIKVAEPTGMAFERKPTERGYDPASTPSRIDEAARSFEKVMDTILEMAASYVKIRKMGEEIKKTTRRVNALEQNVIPRLRGEVRFIRAVLEEREREDVFRMKLMKGDDSDPETPGWQHEDDPIHIDSHLENGGGS